jgi:hypothetical protein
MAVQTLAPIIGWQVIGYTVLANAASNTATITIPAFDLLRITIRVTGYGGNDIASLQFGGVAGAVDTNTNYNTLNATGTNGSNKWDNYANNTTNGFLRIAQNTITNGRVSTVTVTNNATTRKICKISTTSDSGAVGTAMLLNDGNGLWSNTTQQIVAVRLITAGGNNLNAGTGFVVEGINLS